MSTVSVVLPVYNTSLYLSECLDSISNQTFKNFTVYAVDDGSKDNSLEILQHYQQRDKRIRVFHQDNQGVASARNRALAAIYEDCQDDDIVFFFDSDDRIDRNCLEKCVKEVKDVDILIFALSKFTKEGICPSGRTVPVQEYLNQEQLCDYFFRLNKWTKGTTVTLNGLCNKCFKVSVLRDRYFDTSLHIAEDQDFFINLIPFINNAKVIPDSFYQYRLRNSSLTHVQKESGFTNDFYVYQRYLKRKDLSTHIRQGIQHRYIESIWADLQRTMLSEISMREKQGFYREVGAVLAEPFEFDLTKKDNKRVKIMQCGFFFNLLYSQIKALKRKDQRLDL